MDPEREHKRPEPVPVPASAPVLLAEDEQPRSGVQVQGYDEHVRRAYREGRW